MEGYLHNYKLKTNATKEKFKIGELPNRILIGVSNNKKEPLLSIEIWRFGGKIVIESIQSRESQNYEDHTIIMNRYVRLKLMGAVPGGSRVHMVNGPCLYWLIDHDIWLAERSFLQMSVAAVFNMIFVSDIKIRKNKKILL